MQDYQNVDPLECNFYQICPLSELPGGERLYIEIDQYAIVVFNIAGYIYAIADLCSHDDGPLGEGELDGFEIVCPRHGARFDVRTGKVQSLPAIVSIPSYPVRIMDGLIEIGIPRE